MLIVNTAGVGGDIDNNTGVDGIADDRELRIAEVGKMYNVETLPYH